MSSQSLLPAIVELAEDTKWRVRSVIPVESFVSCHFSMCTIFTITIKPDVQQIDISGGWIFTVQPTQYGLS